MVRAFRRARNVDRRHARARLTHRVAEPCSRAVASRSADGARRSNTGEEHQPRDAETRRRLQILALTPDQPLPHHPGMDRRFLLTSVAGARVRLALAAGAQPALRPHDPAVAAGAGGSGDRAARKAVKPPQRRRRRPSSRSRTLKCRSCRWTSSQDRFTAEDFAGGVDPPYGDTRREEAARGPLCGPAPETEREDVAGPRASHDPSQPRSAE
jgi:hypothetical protein